MIHDLKYSKPDKGILEEENNILDSTLPFKKTLFDQQKQPESEAGQMCLIKRRGRRKLYVAQQKNNYFENMYKESKKKANVNLFVRKLKQNSVLRTMPEELEKFQEDEEIELYKTIQWKKWVQIVYEIAYITHVLVMSIVTSLCLAFPSLRENPIILSASITTVIFGLFEIGVNLTTKSSINSKYLERKSNLIRNIGIKYVKKYFFFDLLIVVVFLLSLFFHSEFICYFKILIICKIYRAAQKLKNLEIYFLENLFREQYWELAKVFFCNFFFAHFIACLLILMSTEESESWLTQNNLHNLVWWQQYLWSYYWATTIMLTVGFGDLTPTNSKEIVFIILIETFSCILLAYSINNVGSIIKKITSYEEQKNQSLKVFTSLEKKEEMSEDIKGKIRNYIIKSAELKRKFNVDAQKELLGKLPKTFNDQYKKQSIVKIFSGLRFFRNLSMTKLSQIALKVEKKLAHSEEILLQCGEVPEIMIANKGHIVLTMSRNGLRSHGKEIQDVEVGENEYKLLSQYFFTNKQMNYDIKCKDFTIIYTLRKEELMTVLNSNPYCYEYFCMEKDRDYYNPSELEVIPCKVCKGNTYHTLCGCPRLHYMPIKSHIIFKQNKKQFPFKLDYFLKHIFKIRIGHKKTSCLKEYTKNKNIYCQEILSSQNKDIEQELLRNRLKMEIMAKRKTILEKYREEANEREIEDQSFFGPSSQVISMKEICKKVGEEIKEEVMKLQEKVGFFAWDLECDKAQDFKFYFQKENPSKLFQKLKVQ